MCTPDLLEELAIGWLHGEGYIDTIDQVRLRPCATDLGFWADVPEDRVAAVQAEGRSLCWPPGAVPSPLSWRTRTPLSRNPRAARRRDWSSSGDSSRRCSRGESATRTPVAFMRPHWSMPPFRWIRLVGRDPRRRSSPTPRISVVTMRWTRYSGSALLARIPVAGLGLLVTGRISAELAFKAARAGLAYVATPSVPSTLAIEIARRSGMVLVGRAVSGHPQHHGAVRPSAA